MIAVRLCAMALPLVLASVALADVHSEDLFRSIESENLQLLTSDECSAEGDNPEFTPIPNEEQLLLMAAAKGGVKPNRTSGWFDWTPSGAPGRANEPTCSADHLEELILQSSADPYTQAAFIRGFFERCNRHLARFKSKEPGVELMQLLGIQYNLCNHPNIRKVRFHLPDGNVLRGYLALKPDLKPRPLILVRCGVYCNAGTASHRMQIMHLFDESPFNVLALANVTGSEYVIDNKHLALGGYDEGMQLMRIADIVRASELNRYITSLHFAGVSLGSHGGLFASYVNEHRPGARLFNSALAICPVVDLQNSMKDLFADDMKGVLASVFFFRHVMKVIESVPILRDLFPDLDWRRRPSPTMIPELIADGALDYYRKLPDDWALPPFTGHKLQTRDDLWSTNRFLTYAAKIERTPTLAFAAADDWIVLTKSNSRELGQIVNPIAGSKVNVVTTEHGNHCAFGMTYGWDVISALHRAFILSHSPEMMNLRETRFAPLNEGRFPWHMRLWSGEKHFSQHWVAKAEHKELRVLFKILSPYQERNPATCQGSPYEMPETCFRDVTYKIPFTELPALAPEAPESEAAAEGLTRWANTHLRIVDAAGRSLHMTENPPAQIKWIHYRSDEGAQRTAAR